MNIQPINASPTPAPPTPLSTFEAGGVSREAKTTEPIQQRELAAQPASQEQLDAAVKSVREYIEPFNSNLEFSVDERTDHVVIKVVDKETEEVIRQIPSEEMLAIAKALDKIQGLLLKQKA